MKVLRIALGHPKVGGTVILAFASPYALVAIGLGCAVIGVAAGVMLYRLELEKSRNQHLPETAG